MKTIIFTFFCFLLSQSNNQIFELENIKNEYKKSQKINALLHNISNKNIFYYISLYSYDADWREVISDIDNPNNRIVRFTKLGANNKILKKISIKKTFNFLENINFNKYKLVIKYKIDNDTTVR